MAFTPAKLDDVIYDNGDDNELDQKLYAAHAEIQSFADLEAQRGTPIPALFNQFFKFIQNPSTVSIETYKRMVDTDDSIGAGIDFIQTCLAARIGAYQHPNDEVMAFVQKALDEMEGGFFNTLKDTLEATWAGFSVQEIVWANKDMGFVPNHLAPLPPTTILFETTRTGQLTSDGILQYQKNYNPGAMSSSGFGWSGSGFGRGPDAYAKYGDLPFPIRTGNSYTYLAIRIPTQKCIHYANRAPGQFGNPYGRSVLRRAYKWWVMKDTFLRFLSIALDRKGTPLNILYTDPNAAVLTQNAATAGKNQRGTLDTSERADVAGLRAFANVHNDSTISLPGKKGQVYEVQTIDQKSNASDFIESINLCDRGIMRAMLIPSLIFTNGDGTGSFALGQEHAKTWEKILDGQGEGVKQAWIKQCISQIIRYNFPESVWKKDGFGFFAKRELSQDERDKEMTIIATACDKGFIDASELKDLNTVREKIGFPPVKAPIITRQESEQGDDEDNLDDGSDSKKS